MPEQVSHVLGGIELGHLSSKADSIAHWVRLFKEIEPHVTNVADLIEHPFLWSEFFKVLYVSEYNIDHCLCVG